MPKSISKRDVILKTSVVAGDVATFSINMDADFTTDLTGSTITYEDESGGNKDEKTKFKMVFANRRSPAVGAVTICLVGDPKPDGGADITKPIAMFDFDPTAAQGNVQQIGSPARSFDRVWKQKVRNGSNTEIVNNVAKIDVRVEAASGYTVTQSVATPNDNTLVLTYAWSSPAAGVVTGTVTLTTSVTPNAGYTLGPIKITDTPFPPT